MQSDIAGWSFDAYRWHRGCGLVSWTVVPGRPRRTLLESEVDIVGLARTRVDLLVPPATVSSTVGAAVPRFPGSSCHSKVSSFLICKAILNVLPSHLVASVHPGRGILFCCSLEGFFPFFPVKEFFLLFLRVFPDPM